MSPWAEESDASGGKFYNSRELSEAQIAAHMHMMQIIQNPEGCDMHAANEAFAQFIELNYPQMTAEERAIVNERCERASEHKFRLSCYDGGANDEQGQGLRGVKRCEVI
jgi:hypothetical protein